MNRVFVSGSISIKTLPIEVIKSFDKIIAQNIQVIVGDADGIDALTQNYFESKNYINLTVCFIYDRPRNLASNLFEIKKIDYDTNLKSQREKQTAKDIYMTNNTDYSFVIWDGKSKGSYANIKRAIENNKKLKVHYIQEELTVQNIDSIYK
jgi:hypothetical protein